VDDDVIKGVRRIRPQAEIGLEDALGGPGGPSLANLFTGKVDLPIQRRGFTAYHGSTNPDLTSLSSKHAVETPGTTWHTSEPDVASTFTVPREYGEPLWDHPPGGVYEVNLAPRNPLELHGPEAQRFSDYNTPSVIEAARRRAHDMIIARNVNEGIGDPQRSDVYAVLDDSIAKLLGKLKW
jgi:hypothetical protein